MNEIVNLKPKLPEPPEKFVVGSTVALRSGGAAMTVRKPGKQLVTVDWLDANDTLCTADFPPAMLQHYDPDEEEKDGA